MIKYGVLYVLLAVVCVGAVMIADRVHNDHSLTGTKNTLSLDNNKDRAEFAAEIVHKYILKPDQSLPISEDGLFPYLYGYADLNNNGSDEVFILMQTEEYCTKTGCQGYLFNHTQKKLAQWVNIYQPILLADESHNGWRDILIADDSIKINTLKIEDCLALNVHQPLSESIEAIEHSVVPSVAIIDDENTLIGQLDWQFAINTQREIYETRLMAGTGMDEGDDLFSPIFRSSKKRGLWLGINLLTAILASITIGLFEDVITQVVALAVLMPIVASMGGIAGSQTLTLMVRAMALNQITPGNRFTLLKNELGIGSINGLLWSLIIGGLAGAWFQSFALGATISLAIIINIITAALFGVLIPITLDKFKLDPALAGSVILTTVTDVVGFFAFLGTASLVMM
jgi:cation transporter-like permease